MNRDLFNLENFKKWMSEQKQPFVEKKSRLIGLMVESKIKSTGRIAKNIQPKSGDLDEMASDFKKYGGQILDVNDRVFLIEVDSGKFEIHRCFVRKKEN